MRHVSRDRCLPSRGEQDMPLRLLSIQHDEEVAQWIVSITADPEFAEPPKLVVELVQPTQGPSSNAGQEIVLIQD
jgi:hypothetical protein